MSPYQTIVERRLRGIGIIIIVMAFVLLWRMFDIQIMQHGHYLALAQGQQRFEKTEIAQRGKIYVHDSAIDNSIYYPLAFDVKSFSVWLVPKQILKKEETAKMLEPMLGIPSSEIFNQINNDKVYIPPTKKGLNLLEANKIKEQNIAGIFVMPDFDRYYPEATLASHVLGFVNAESEGQYGFEGHYDNELQGSSGTVVGEKDTLGRMINLLDQKDPKDGTSYVLTIDRSVQYFVEKKLAEALPLYQADSGSVVIMDLKTGGILAMASSPTYNPNNFKEHAKADQGIFINPVIAHLYEPGSVFKPIIMASAIDAGTVTPETKEKFSNMTIVDGFEIHTALDKAYGEETMTQVLENSDNVAMVWLAEKFGAENMYKYIQAFGLLDKTGVDLDSEVPGYVPALKDWHNIGRATIAFGQGISISPIELLSAYATIANKGKYIYPHVVDKIIYSDGTEKQIEKQEGEQVIKEDTANKMVQMLVSVTDSGHAKQAGVSGYAIGAKTGTAQIPKTGGGYEENESLLGIYNHTLAGFAPAEDPRFVMIVKLEKPKTAKYAESTAAPVFGSIASFLLNYHYRIQPTR